VQISGHIDAAGVSIVTSDDERRFFNDLDALRDTVVPVIGAGMAVEPGVPGVWALHDALLAAAGEAWCRANPGAARGSLFQLADALAVAHSELWVQEQVAAIVRSRPLTPTPALKALAKVSSGLIVTTNYDLAIEHAAHAAGQRVETYTLGEFDLALRNDSGLRVVHLHGVIAEPETIVLTTNSYERILGDERAQLVMRDLAVRFHLLFLGHSLSANEVHIRRDVEWTLRRGPSGSAPGHRHLLVTSESAWDAGTQASWNEVAVETGVQVWVFPDPMSEHLAAKRAAHVIAGPSSVETAEYAPNVPVTLFDRHYLPLPVATTADVKDPEAYGTYLYQTWQFGERLADSLDDDASRLLLVAGGGFGKTQELLQIARRSSRSPLYQPLSNFQAQVPGAEPEQAFVRCMATAMSAGEHAVPKLTLPRLRDEAYVFLLDGLDEVPIDRRGQIVQLINDVSATYPQHRWVVASRLLSELDALIGFESWTLLVDGGWLARYAQHRSVQLADLDAVTEKAPSLADLINIPIFAASVVDHVIRGKALPSTAIRIVWRFVDTHMESDPRVGAEPDHVRRWLDRIALRMEITGVTELTREEALATALHVDLPNLAPTGQMLDALIDRALLVDAAAMVRFPAHVVQQARAARALLSMPDHGLDVLRRFVLVELPAADGQEAPVRTVRESWVSTLELALPDAPPSWWHEIVTYDPMLTARAAARTPHAPSRPDASLTIWRTYVARRVWLDRGASTMERDDGGAITLLLKNDPPPPGLHEELLTALHDEDPTYRANALQILAVMDDREEAIERVRTAVRDPHPVVRRIAAMTAYNLQAAVLASALAEQAKFDPDSMAPQTLIDIAIDLAHDDAIAIQMAFSAPPRVLSHAIHALTNRCGRSTVLAALCDEDELRPDETRQLLSAILDTERHSDFSPNDVATLIHIVKSNSLDLDETRKVSEALDSQPIAAILARLCWPPGEWLAYDIGRPISIIDDDTLEGLLTLILKSRDQIADAIGVHLRGDLNTESVDQAREHIARNMTARRTSSARPSSAHTSAEPEALPIDTTSLAGLAAILRGTPKVVQSQLTREQKGSLRFHVEHELATIVAEGKLPIYAGQNQMPSGIWNTLEWAAHFHLPLTPDAWLQIAQLAARWPDNPLPSWLKKEWSPASAARLIDALPDTDTAAAGPMIPKPWPDDLISAVLHSARIDDLSLVQMQQISSFLQQARNHAKVTAWLLDEPPTWLFPQAVEVGNCNAERRLLEQLTADSSTGPNWPSRSDNLWLAHVQCPSNATAVVDALRSALLAERDLPDVEPLYRALDRCAGQKALTAYDRLIVDPAIPGARFIYYQRQIALNAIAEAQVRSAVFEAESLDELIIEATAERSTR
jgi:hypothetical protein